MTDEERLAEIRRNTADYVEHNPDSAQALFFRLLDAKDREIAELRMQCLSDEGQARAALAERDAALAQVAAMRQLLDDKQFISCLADYNRGHLSHANYLNEKLAALDSPAPTSDEKGR